MADDILLNAGTGGDTIAADDIGGIKYQRVKLIVGANNTNDGDVASGNPLPISAASLPLPSGAATGAKQDTGNTSLASIDGKITAVNTGAVVISSGTVAVSTINSVAPAFNTGVRGATVQRVTVATDDIVPASQSGTWTVQPGNTANTTAWKVDGSAVTQPVSMATNTPVGTVAHDGVDSGAPIKMGAKATTALSGVTLVSSADRTDLYAGVDGVVIVREHCNLEDQVQERATNTDGASTAFASGLAAPGAGVRLWITQATLCNSSATFCTVDLRDGSAGSVLWTLPVPATGGVVQNFNPPLKLTANTALAFDASAATTTLTISALGFKSKV